MNKELVILFFEDYFICTILPNENAWEVLKVNGTGRQLLYFYVKDNVIRNDDFARDRFNAGDKNAFGDFYNSVVREGETFTKFDLQFKPVHLLKDILEQVKLVYVERINDFLQGFGNNEKIPVNVCFIPGITEDAREAIGSFLTDEGFDVCQADYLSALSSILFRRRIINEKTNFSIIESHFGDLFFHYIEYDKKIIKHASKTLVGKGVDYRVGNLAKLIVDKAAKKTSSRILFDSGLLENEIKRFHKRAKDEMNNFEYGELDITVELSDYSRARVIIDIRELDKMSSEPYQFVSYKYEDFISHHSNLMRTEKILLHGEAVSSDSFISFFEKKYGSGKIKLLDNFEEILSRGVSSVSPKQDEDEGPLSAFEIIGIMVKPKVPVPPDNKRSKPVIPPDIFDEPKSPPVPSPGNGKDRPPVPPVSNKVPPPPLPSGQNFVGKTAIAVTNLNPAGKIEFNKKHYNATANGKNIAKGKKVKILGMVSNIYKVEEVSSAPPPPPLPKKKV